MNQREKHPAPYNNNINICCFEYIKETKLVKLS